MCKEEKLRQISSASPRQQNGGGREQSTLNFRMLFTLQTIESEKNKTMRSLNFIKIAEQDLKEKLQREKKKNFLVMVEFYAKLNAMDQEIADAALKRGRYIVHRDRIYKEIPQEKSLRRAHAMQNHLTLLENRIGELDAKLAELCEKRKKSQLAGQMTVGVNQARKELLEQILANTAMDIEAKLVTIDDLSEMIQRIRQEILQDYPESLAFYDELKRRKNISDPLAVIQEQKNLCDTEWVRERYCSACNTAISDIQFSLIKNGARDERADCAGCKRFLF